ncbi:hypothetical protein PsAD2_04683 [Pseudovibrio axinellae]|uniref:Uncharacterized protein n=1 Tax=Pseudovibrio axinellae TaxID=989403 RepID=A0A165SX33_9HYPH|nr:hypothetical protein PsAD2_04683 [Pseudovibrio axinellae]
MHIFTNKENILDIIQMIHIFFSIDHSLPYALVIYTYFEEYLDGLFFGTYKFRKIKWQQYFPIKNKSLIYHLLFRCLGKNTKWDEQPTDEQVVSAPLMFLFHLLHFL